MNVRQISISSFIYITLPSHISFSDLKEHCFDQVLFNSFVFVSIYNEDTVFRCLCWQSVMICKVLLGKWEAFSCFSIASSIQWLYCELVELVWIHKRIFEIFYLIILFLYHTPHCFGWSPFVYLIDLTWYTCCSYS